MSANNKLSKIIATIGLVTAILAIISLIVIVPYQANEKERLRTQKLRAFMDLSINSYGVIEEREIVLTAKSNNSNYPITASFRYYENNILRISSEPHYFTVTEGQYVIFNKTIYAFDPINTKDENIASAFRPLKNNE